MQFKSLFTAVLVAAPALAAPSPVDAPSKTIEKRSTTVCGDWDSIQTGTYTLWANLWGYASATSGSQCSTVDSLSGNTITWSTSWTWAGGPYSVKSYSEITLDQSTGYQVSSISSIPTVWDWSYTGSNIVADVSYDMFTSSTATGSNDYEIMIWLAALGGAGPISATGSPIATPTIAGTTWNLSYGLNGATKVFSFVAQSQVTSFSADLKLFFNYLATYQDFTASQYLKSINSGTEPFTGSNAVLTTTAYSVYYVMGTSSGTTTSSAGKAVTSTASTSTSTGSSGTGAALWGQCGGTGWTGPTTCATGTCTYSNPYYSQCLS